MPDAQSYEWTFYITQHYMKSHHFNGFLRMLYTNGIFKITNITAKNNADIISCIIKLSLQMKEINLQKTADQQYMDMIMYLT